MPLTLALEVIEQAARALAAAEKIGVVHRDIKPSNIMLESDPSGTPIVKVIDYGIAKILDPEAERGAEQTQTGFIGIPAFASPGICFPVVCHLLGARFEKLRQNRPRNSRSSN
jgi:eukaryotic-like serine/threonine-protein kinase